MTEVNGDVLNNSNNCVTYRCSAKGDVMYETCPKTKPYCVLGADSRICISENDRSKYSSQVVIDVSGGFNHTFVAEDEELIFNMVEVLMDKEQIDYLVSVEVNEEAIPVTILVFLTSEKDADILVDNVEKCISSR